MSTEQNKALIRRLFEESDNRKGELPADRFAPDYVYHFPASPEPLPYQGHVHMARMFYAAFPDLHHSIEDQIAEGDRVVTRITIRGTHQGELMGIAPTGKQIIVTAISIDRIVNSKIAEEWVNSDVLGMLQQLGAVPTPTQTA
jgi:predicted ester cyclase